MILRVLNCAFWYTPFYILVEVKRNISLLLVLAFLEILMKVYIDDELTHVDD